MAAGPGKYNPQLKAALESAKGTSGVLIVFDGAQGAGFAVTCAIDNLLALPTALRFIADSIDKDMMGSPQ